VEAKEAQEPVYLKDWRSSQAKKVLKRLIKDGRVKESMPAELVYLKYKGFKNYKFPNLKTNLQNLLTSVADDAKNIAFDKAAMRLLCPSLDCWTKTRQ
jgi:hypothetical protein